uniref:J domain-containing protein n=1 Tax=Glossina palpalis gambiensis TaxID=67801 RepID=A0A1B0AXW1_9MUSC
MKSLLKPIQASLLLQSFINCRKTSYVYQFKTQKQTHYYRDCQRETKRVQENFEVHWWLKQMEGRICLKATITSFSACPRDAITSQIKAAYCALAKHHHPDESTCRHQVSISKRFQDILNAY